MQPRHLRAAWKKALWLRRLYGMILDPSTADAGVDCWIASSLAIRASQTASPESEPDPAMIDGSSISCSAWSMRAGLIVSSERTSQGMQTDSSKLSSGHWKEWVIALRRESSQRPKLVQATNESGSSSWPTPMAGAAAQNGNNIAGNSDFSRKAMKLADEMQWPTATAGEAKGSGNRNLKGSKANQGTSLTDATERGHIWQTPATDSFRSRGGDRKHEQGLDQQAREFPNEQWRTPQCGDATRGPKSQRGKSSEYKDPAGKHSLVTEAAACPTPNAMVSNDGETPETFDKRKAKHKARGINGNGMGDTLSIAALLRTEWPTLASQDHKGANSAEHVTTNGTGRMHMDQLPNFVEHSFSRHGQATPPGRSSLTPIHFSPLPSERSISGALHDAISDFRRWSERSGGAAGWQGIWIRQPRRKLNPRFVELLMAWPIGWTGSGSAETEFSRWLSLSRGYVWSLRSSKPEAQLTLL